MIVAFVKRANHTTILLKVRMRKMSAGRTISLTKE
jgi:hypothetical protein